MADWLNIAGGAGKGYVEGDQDNQRRAEFNFMQDQRRRAIKQQKMDDELAAQLGRVRPAGDYTDAAPGSAIEAAPDFVGPGSGTKKVKVTAADADRQRADIMARGGRLSDLQAAATLRQGAFQTDAAERAERNAQAQEVLMQAGRLKASGNLLGAARVLQQGYAKYPDGHEIVIEDKNGVPHSGVAGPDGKYISPPTPITSESVDAMIQQGVTMLSPDTYFKGQEMGLKKEELGVHRISAEAAMSNARTAYQKMLFETGDEAKAELAAKTQYYKDTGQAHLITANAAAARDHAAATASKAGQSLQFTDKDTGETVYATRVQNKDGTSRWEREVFPAGLTPAKGPQAAQDLTPRQKALLEVHKAKAAAGGFKSTVEEEAALDKILDSKGGTIGQLKAGDPRTKNKVPFGPSSTTSPLTAATMGIQPSGVEPQRGNASAPAAEETSGWQRFKDWTSQFQRPLTAEEIASGKYK